MAKLLKLRRGTSIQHGSFTGAEGEVTIDTDKDTAVVHDGSTAGGKPLAKEDLTNVSSATIAGRLDNDSIATSKIAAGALPTDVTIVNANVSATAAIANSKLADSGVSAGTVGSSTAIPVVTVNSKGIVTNTSTTAVDSTTIANGTSNVAVANNGNITTTRSGTARLVVDDAGVDVTGTLDVTGNLGTTGQLSVVSAAPEIFMTDTNANSDFSIVVNSGQWRVRDETNSANRLAINSDGHIDIYGNVDFDSGIDVTGNITCTGTVDGRDVAADGTKLDGVESGATADQTAAEIRTLVGNASDSNVFTDADHAKLDALTTSNGVILNGVTATTQSAGDNSTKVATTAYTDTAITNLVDSSPGALNTLNELAAAINDDASFSTTITNSIATKMPLAGGEFTGNVTCENITPDGDSSRNLGTNSVRFANVYADNFVGSGSNLTGIEAFVSGMILLWSGSTGSIPSGFVLCNGSNSTPDLRDRFVVGAGNSYSVGNTGGATTRTDTVNISGSDSVNISVSGSGSVGNEFGQFGSTNLYGYNGTGIQYRNMNNFYWGTTTHNHAYNFSGSGSDTVNISGSDTVSIDTRSPYYALCYIMKT